MKYIIDTDPGIDDAIGIMLGVKNNLDIIGFTLATGNIAEEKARVAEQMSSKFQNDAYRVQLEKIEIENELKFYKATR